MFCFINFALDVDDISQVLIELSEVVDWHRLGLHLKVRPSTLEGIQEDFRDRRRAKEEMLKFWLEQDPESTLSESAATWKSLVKALKVIDQRRVAKTIEEKVSCTLLDLHCVSYKICSFSIVYYFCSTLTIVRSNVEIAWNS